MQTFIQAIWTTIVEILALFWGALFYSAGFQTFFTLTYGVDLSDPLLGKQLAHLRSRITLIVAFIGLAFGCAVIADRAIITAFSILPKDSARWIIFLGLIITALIAGVNWALHVWNVIVFLPIFMLVLGGTPLSFTLCGIGCLVGVACVSIRIHPESRVSGALLVHGFVACVQICAFIGAMVGSILAYATTDSESFWYASDSVFLRAAIGFFWGVIGGVIIGVLCGSLFALYLCLTTNLRKHSDIAGLVGTLSLLVLLWWARDWLQLGSLLSISIPLLAGYVVSYGRWLPQLIGHLTSWSLYSVSYVIPLPSITMGIAYLWPHRFHPHLPFDLPKLGDFLERLYKVDGELGTRNIVTAWTNGQADEGMHSIQQVLNKPRIPKDQEIAIKVCPNETVAQVLTQIAMHSCQSPVQIFMLPILGQEKNSRLIAVSGPSSILDLVACAEL